MGFSTTVVLTFLAVCGCVIGQVIRDDGRCGEGYTTDSGEEAICGGNNPCCSSHNWCGNGPAWCDCDGCKDYSDNVPTPPPYLCGLRPALGRVVGGHDSEEGASPWIGSLRLAGYHSCGATLIDPIWAITAAHCVGVFDEIVLGDLKLDIASPYHQKKTVRIFEHPGFDDILFINDIALLRLSPSADINSNVRPACLATSQSEVTTYSNCFVAGWGATSEGGASPNILQEAAVDLLTEDECRDFYGDEYFPETMICAGFPKGGIDTCQGDSGGPLVCQAENNLWHLVGVTSWGSGCARPENPGVYTRVSKFTTFIEDIRNVVVCSNGTILLSSVRCDYIRDCQDGSDEAECDPIPIDTTISLSSTDYPESYPNSADVIYLISGESGSHLYIQFDDFSLEYGYDMLYVGYGSSPDDNSTRVATLTGAERPENVIIEDNNAWLQFTSDKTITEAGFQAEIRVIGKEVSSFVCSDGHVTLADSVCDQTVDCTDNMEDETNCEPLPYGSSFTFESPNYPDKYTNDYTRTYLFIAEDSLRIKLTFDHFDLEKKFDTLTIGHGQDPKNEGSILNVLTGLDVPDEIISPTSAMWMTFVTDESVKNTGFRFNVIVI